MQEFSTIELAMRAFEKKIKTKALHTAVTAWQKEDATEEARLKRVKAASIDFWTFDKIYFTPEIYDGGYFDPCVMHKVIEKAAFTPGVNIVFGPREHGKTATAKKVLTWALLTNKVSLAGTYAETITKATDIIDDIVTFISDNPRINFDFKPEIIECNADRFKFCTHDGVNPTTWRTVMPFSDGRSVRGSTSGFSRPQLLIGDDIETLESCFTEAATDLRIKKIAEAYKSLQSEVGTFLIMANNLDKYCALNKIKNEYEQGLLNPEWRVFTFKAWNHEAYTLKIGKFEFKIPKGTLWRERYKAKTERALIVLLKPKDAADWEANFQQNPIPPQGFIFKEEFKNFFVESELPKDCKGVIYCDPNLSLKSKGDTTAITVLLYSRSTLNYYIPQVICQSFSSSGALIAAIYNLADCYQNEVKGIGQDGHVSQESHWTEHLKNYWRDKGRPCKPIEFKSYKVNELSKNAAIAWEDGRIFFSDKLKNSKHGKEYLRQVIAFAGKKKKGVDDAPDSLICAFEFIHERKLGRRRKSALSEGNISKVTYGYQL